MEDEEYSLSHTFLWLTHFLSDVGEIRGIQKFYRAHSSHLWARREQV